jgi:hypothetical protein
MEQITDYIEKFKADLPELFDNVLSSYQDKINGDFADEYNIPEHEYVQSHPLVQLNDKLFDMITNNTVNHQFKFQNNIWIKNPYQYVLNIHGSYGDLSFIHIYKYQYGGNSFNDKVYYKYDKLLQKNEYCIAFIIEYCVAMNNSTNNTYYYYNNIIIKYITNYGRFLKVARGTDIKLIYNSGNYQLSDARNKEDENTLIDGCKLYKYDIVSNSNKVIRNGYPKLLTDIDANEPPLTYKFPKLFLDVINAFRNESTDEMQKCCEKYNLLLQKANNGNDKKIKHLEDENARLKKEIELLKIQLEEQRKHFMG